MPDNTALLAADSDIASALSERVADIVGVDVGGTKTHVAAVLADGKRRDSIVPSSSWRHGALFDDPANIDRLVGVIRAVAALGDDTSLVLGMHGCDNATQRSTALAAIGRLVPGRVQVINDAALLGPAAGTDACIQLIVGTGAILIGQTPDGRELSVEGYGWLLGDTGSAPGLVRDAMRSLVYRADRMMIHEDPLADPFARALAEIYGVDDITELALAFTVDAGATAWGAHAPALFDAAASGSPVALDTLRAAAATIADGVAALVRRGATGSLIVAAGGVIVNQPLLQDLLRSELVRVAPGLRLQVLTDPPVEGALALAARPAPGELT